MPIVSFVGLVRVWVVVGPRLGTGVRVDLESVVVKVLGGGHEVNGSSRRRVKPCPGLQTEERRSLRWRERGVGRRVRDERVDGRKDPFFPGLRV